MSKKTYKDLAGDVKHYLNRNDEDTLSRIPTWIHLAQDTLDRILRHPAAETVIRFPVKVGADIIPIPTNLLELKNLRNSKTGEVLYRRSLETLYLTPLHSKFPTGYSRKGVEYILNKPAEEEFEMEVIYYTAPTKLSKPGDINLYTLQCYDMMMYYAIAEAFSYLQDPSQAQYFQQKAEASYNMLMDSIRREEFSGSTLVYFSDEAAMSQYF